VKRHDPHGNRCRHETRQDIPEPGIVRGFRFPPAEAMLCGCVVVGYHGKGGQEYFFSP
jgi:hypothetical protein